MRMMMHMRLVAIVVALLVGGCSTIQEYQANSQYNARLAANQTEFENGQIPLSEKLRRDYIAGIQYKRINKIEAACTETYMWLAQDVEQGKITDARFNARRDSLEMTCNMAYATNQYAPVDSWRLGYLYSRNQ
jgi:hypothetical protein